MQNILSRYDSLLNTNIRFFYHSDFKVADKLQQIVSEMPEMELYEKAYIKIQKIKTSKINPEMNPCYQKPLLTFLQEQHLFKKMNFYKYKAKCALVKIDHKDPNELDLKIVEEYLAHASGIRNEIAESNFRLATQIMKHRNFYNQNNSNPDSLLSDAYFDVLKAVDYFNWTLGHKFSTYATWVVKKNFFRDSKQKSAYNEKFSAIDEAKVSLVENRTTGYVDERDHSSRQALIRSLLDLLLSDDSGTDRKRQVYVLENYFGVNGSDRKTLEKISAELGVTKERVRQLKEKGLEWIKSKVHTMGLEYNNESPDDTLFEV